MTEGRVVKWLKREGDRVAKGEPLFEVETEKATVEVEAPASGILGKILAGDGTVLPVGGLVAVLSEPGEAVPTVAVPAAMPTPPAPSPVIQPVLERGTPAVEGEEAKVSPAARRLARELGVDLLKVTGSGPDGRIVREDVLRVAESQKAAPKTELAPPQASPTPRGNVIPLTGMRKVIADRMSYSARTAPRVTIFMEVDMSEVVRVRERLLPEIEKAAKVRLTYTEMLVKAVAKALESHPIVNSIIAGEEIRLMDEINIGVAVAVEEGLVVPVVHEANKKSLAEIAVGVERVVEKARKREKLLPEEVQGSTFTITNTGLFGVDFSTPIINPPESAILGFGRIVEKPVVVGGQIVVRPMGHLSLSFDHRVMDGTPAAQFLADVKRILENYYVLLT